VALAVLVVCLTVLPLVALATFTPWPLEVAVLLLGLAAAGIVALVTAEAFPAASAFVLLTSAFFTARTAGETLRRVRPRPARARRRPRARRLTDEPKPAAPWWASLDRERDAA
jgi:hypothetical protein